ncbi:hypothetical protein [Halostagnicola kamekurae]|uniref:Uncharacterized protein n=1 Tax=Halostagnicola kamekurae TaxID=619731 RepID=A0A1I6QPS2_9EURY|nr:hypothetical protein [Halostagnicola kamekurae]SFS54308.1 hypothetical protein SAMN04488556_1424 [Halostagnicola kamekurae]
MTTQNPGDGSRSRRTFLATSGATVLAATAGCTTVVDFIGDQLLEEVNVFNETNRKIAGSITIESPAGETVLDGTFDLISSENDDGTSSEDDGQSVATYDDVWDGAGDYEATVRVDGTEIDGQAQASETVTIDDPDELMLAAALGSGEVDEPIGFRVGESLSDFGR